MNDLLNIQKLLGANFDQEKIFEMINHRFVEYKEAYKKSSNEAMDEATIQLANYIYQGFIKVDVIYNTIVNYVAVSILKIEGQELDPEDQQLNKELSMWIRTISDQFPHEKEDHNTFLEFIKRIFNSSSELIQVYLDEQEDEEEDDEQEEEPEVVEKPKAFNPKDINQMKEAFKDVKLDIRGSEGQGN